MNDTMTADELVLANRILRNADESHLRPIGGRFNVTERAIRRVRKQRKKNGEMSFYEYIEAVETEISQIVNDERNW